MNDADFASEAPRRGLDVRYWFLILSGCTMGETAADFLSHGPLGLGYVVASAVLGALVALALAAQGVGGPPGPVRYWTTIVVMSTAGTTLADAITRTLELGYLRGSALLVTLFVAVLLVGRWRRSPSVYVARSEHAAGLPPTDAWYWAAVMVASTLGTTLGDAASNGTPLGFGGCAAALMTILVGLLWVVHRARRPMEVLYWATLITASTIGATTGDWLTKDEGLGFGYFWGNGLLIVLFVGVVALGSSKRDEARGARRSTST